jgi:endo-1,4-beta-mannosidase
VRYSIHQHRFGVNYTPTRAWYHCWNDFEADAIARDFDAVALLGADHIRLMLLWPSFQPDPDVVSSAHLQRLDAVMRLAAERHLDVCVTLFVGWLSGYAYKPAWQKDESFYDLPASAGPQLRYLEAVTTLAAGHPNFLGIDLGNELSCCWRAATGGGDAWSRHMLAAAARVAPDGVHVNGADHQPWIGVDHEDAFGFDTFSPGHLARDQAIVALHCWPWFSGAIARSGGDAEHDRVKRLPQGMAALARAHAGDANKPVWIQEFGMAETWTDPDRIPDFLRLSTEHALAHGVAWFTWWCSHDLDRAYRFDPLEYGLGLIDHGNRLKPAGRAFKALADAWRGKPVAVQPEGTLPPPNRVRPETTWAWLDAWREGPEL